MNIGGAGRRYYIDWTVYYRRVAELARFVVRQAIDGTITEIRFLKSGYVRSGESIVRAQWVNMFREATQLVIYILQYNNRPKTEDGHVPQVGPGRSAKPQTHAA